ncbi:MAG TPA: hypothetical protein VL181_11720, partial [Holophagaceae bacterium]|nr:hypothetical protein [Holophagaceae bacterium]
MTQLPISNPPAFPQAGTRSKALAIGILAALVAVVVAGAFALTAAHAPRHAELTPAPPSYADALKQAEAEDLAKGVTPEMAASLRALGSVDAAA